MNKTTEALKLSLPALENAESVAASINAGKRHAIQVDEETCFWQREEWVRWAIDEVLPEIRQALAAIREALAEQQHPERNWPSGGESEPVWVLPGGGLVGKAEPVKQEPVAVGNEWKPCMKLPIVVHVREQREGETHVSTREGITPILPTDLIMRGVAGEEYPIGYELFNKTYTFEITAPVDVKAIRAEALEEAAKVCDWYTKQADINYSEECAAAIRGLK